MVGTSINELDAGRTDPTYDRKTEVQAFEDSKAGVKGLLESGVTKIPRMFYSNRLNSTESESSAGDSKFSIPVIDLKDMHKNAALHAEGVDQIGSACQKWGFFQVINHGIPVDVLDEMIDGIRRFHEQNAEIRKQFYCRDSEKKVRYFSNNSLFRDQAANWRDTLTCIIAPNPPKPEEIPAVCRDIVIEYSERIRTLSYTILELLAEALGLNPSYLKKMDCAEGLAMVGHYYPPCPEPELTMGITKHSDSDFMTILLQDQMGGLQVLHEGQWVDVSPIHGALVVNIGDLIQLMTNDRFISVHHRVLAKHTGPRISVAMIILNFGETSEALLKVYGPLKELLSEENPPMYREITLKEFLANYFANSLGDCSLQPFRL